MAHFTDLEIWKTGVEVVKEIYKLTKKFPRTELYELTSQVQKSATSILLNFAEGFGRFTYADKANKYVIARGECTETEAALHIAIGLNFLSVDDTRKAMALTQKMGKMLSGLITFYRNKS